MSNVNSNVIEPEKSTENPDLPTYVTKEEVISTVNSALTSHLKRLNFSKQIQDTLEASLAPWKEKLTSMDAERSASEVVSPERSAERYASSERSAPDFLALQKKLEGMEKQMKIKEEALLAREKQAKEKDVFAQVRSKLSTLGIRPEAVDSVTKILKAEERIKISEDGEGIFIMEEDELDLDSGLKKYLDPKLNPSISLFLPPKTSAGHQKGFKSNVSVRSTEGHSNQLTQADKALRVLEQLKAR